MSRGRARRGVAEAGGGELEAGRAEGAERVGRFRRQLVFARRLQIVQRAVRRAPNIPRAMQKFPARWMDFAASVEELFSPPAR